MRGDFKGRFKSLLATALTLVMTISQFPAMGPVMTVQAEGPETVKTEHATYTTVVYAKAAEEEEVDISELTSIEGFAVKDTISVTSGFFDGNTEYPANSGDYPAAPSVDTGNGLLKFSLNGDPGPANTLSFTVSSDLYEDFLAVFVVFTTKRDKQIVTFDSDVVEDGKVERGYGTHSFTCTASSNYADAVISYSSDNTAVASVDSAGNVAIYSAGEAKITAKAAATGDDYTGGYLAGSASYVLTVHKKPVTVSGIKAEDKTYNGETGAVLDYSGALIDGVLEADRSYVSVEATGAFQDANAGSGKTVNLSEMVLKGERSGNYFIPEDGQQKTATAAISKAEYKGVKEVSRNTYMGASDSIDLSQMIAEGGTIVSSGISVEDPSVVLDGDPSVADNKLNYKFADNAPVGQQAIVTIPVTSTNYVNYNITVELFVTSLKRQTLTFADVSEGTVETTYGESVTHTATPGSGTPTITYSSSDTSIATVDSSTGKVTTHKNGTVVISAFAAAIPEHTSATESYSLTVKKKTASISWATDSLTYNGSPQAPAASVSNKVGDDSITVTVTGQETSVGEGYTATAVELSDDRYELPELSDRQKTFKIVPKKVTVKGTVTYAGKVYDGTVNAKAKTAEESSWTFNNPPFEGVVEEDELTVAEATGVFDNKNAGENKTLTVTVTLGGGSAANYQIDSFEIKSKIEKKTATVSGITADNKTYDGNTSAVMVVSGASLTGVLDDDNEKVNVSGATGSFADKNVANGKAVTINGVTLGGDEAGNYSPDYSGITGLTANITEKKLSGISWTMPDDLVYNGTDRGIPTASPQGVLTGDEVELSVSIDGGPAVNRGSYTARAAISAGTDKGNYSLPDDPTTTMTVSPLTVTLEWRKNPTDESPATGDIEYDYNGSPQAPTATVGNLVSGDGCNVTVSVEGEHTNVGNYTATASALGGTSSANYMLPETLSDRQKAYSIVQSAPDPSGLPANQKPAALQPTYNKQPQAIIAAPEELPSGYTNVQYMVERCERNSSEYRYLDDEWKDAIPFHTDSAYYKVHVKYIPDSNHTAFELPTPIETWINSKRLTDFVFDPAPGEDGKPHLKYTGEVICPTVSFNGICPGDEVKITNSEITYGDGINAGTQGVSVYGLSNINYTSPYTNTFYYVIDPADPPDPSTLDAKYKPAATNPEYNGQDQALVAAPESLLTGYTKVQYKLKGEENYGDQIPTGRAVGTYTVCAKYFADSNHTDFEMEIEASIKPVSAVLNWSPQPGDDGRVRFVYNGSAQAPTATVGNLLSGESCSVTVTVSGNHMNAGDYTAIATALSNSNYELPDSPYQAYCIIPAAAPDPAGLAPGYKPAAVSGLKFDTGSLSQNLVTAPTADLSAIGYTGVQYSLTNAGDDWSDDIPKGTEAGQYNVYAYYLPDNNHTAFVLGPITVGIDKADAVTRGVAKRRVYTLTSIKAEDGYSVKGAMPDNAKPLTYTAYAEGISVSKEGGGQPSESAGATGFAVDGNGVVTATLSGEPGDVITLPVKVTSENYEESTVNLNVTLTEKTAATVTFPDTNPDSKIYGDSAFTLSVNVTDPGLPLPEPASPWSWESSSTTVAEVDNNGKVTIKGSGTVGITAKYESLTAKGSETWSVNISSRTVEIEWVGTSFSYDGSYHKPNAKVKNPAYNDVLSLTVAGDGQSEVGENYIAEVTGINGENSSFYALPTAAADKTTTFKITPAVPEITKEPYAKADLEYNGAAQVLVETGEVTNGEMLYFLAADDATDAPSSDDPGWIATSPMGTDAKSYKVYYRVKKTSDNYGDIAPKLITGVSIGRSDIDSSVVQSGTLSYNGNAQAAEVTAMPQIKHGRTVSYTYCDSKYGVYTPSVPKFTEARTYTVYYKASAADHNDESGSFDVTIDRRSITDAVITLGEALTYNGNEQYMTVSKVVSGGIEVDDYEVTGNKAKDHKTDGDYDLTVTGKGNFKDTATAKWNIGKTSSSATVKAIEDLRFNGDELALVTGSTGDGTLYYALTDDDAVEPPATLVWGVEKPKARDVGTHYVWYYVKGDGNHEDSPAVRLACKILNAAISYKVTAFDGQYDGAYHGIQVTVTEPSGAVVKYGRGEDACDLDESPTYKDAGSHTVYFEITADNYEKEQNSADVKIAKRPLAIAADPASKVFGKDDPELTFRDNGQLVEGDGITGKLSRGDGEAVGTYPIYQGTVSAGDNYEISYIPAMFTITPDAPYDIRPVARNLTYNGDQQPLVEEDETGRLFYSIDGEDWTQDIPEGKDAGIYSFLYMVKGDADHKDSDPVDMNVSVLTKTLSVNALAQKKVYGDPEPDFTYEYDGLVEGDGFTGTLERDAGEDVGSYAITLGTLSAGDNYDIDFSGQFLTIGRAGSSVTKKPVAKELIYNGSPQELVTAGEAEGGTMEYAIGEYTVAPPETGWSDRIPSAVADDMYIVWYRVSGDRNHFDSDASYVISRMILTNRIVFVVDDEGNESKNYEAEYTGQSVRPEVRVYRDGIRLSEQRDYTVSYGNMNRDAYTLSPGDAGFNGALAPSVTVKMKGYYSGKETRYFTIRKARLSDAQASDVSLVATGKPLRPRIVLTYNDRKLKEGKDYVLDLYSEDGSTRIDTLSEPGVYKAVATPAGNNFMDKKEIGVTVVPNDAVPVSKFKVVFAKKQAWTGQQITPEVTVSYSGNTLVKDKDYTVSYGENICTGTGYVTVTGNGTDYFGSRTESFKITGVSLTRAKVFSKSGDEPFVPEVFTYDGTEHSQDSEKYVVRYNGKALEEGTDYTVSYSGNLNAGKAKMIITAVRESGYTGSIKVPFRILPHPITGEDIVIEKDMSAPLMLGGSVPVPGLSFNGMPMIEGTDYTLTYKDNKKIGNTATYKVKGIGNFGGQTPPISFTITALPLDSEEIFVSAPDKVWRAGKKNYRQRITLMDASGKALTPGEGKDYTVRYYLGDPDGDGRELGDEDEAPNGSEIFIVAAASGSGRYTGSVTASYKLADAANVKSLAQSSVRAASKEHTGQPVELTGSDLTVILKKSGRQLKPQDSDEDGYRIASYYNNVRRGTAVVILEGTGGVTGVRAVRFRIGKLSIRSILGIG